jgi:hypothetical protein
MAVQDGYAFTPPGSLETGNNVDTANDYGESVPVGEGDLNYPVGVFALGLGLGTFFNRTGRSGRVLEVTINTAVTVSIFMQNAITGQGLPGLAAVLAIEQKKPGGAFAAITPAITDRGFGRYDLAFLAAHTDTLTVSDFHVTAPGAFPNDDLQINVIALNKNDAVHAGLSAIPNAFAGVVGGLPVLDASLNVNADVKAIAAGPLLSIANAVLDSLRSGHVVPGSVGEGIAIATSLLQGNFYMDNTNNSSPNGQTAARLRCFHTGVATSAATPGGTGEGEFATFLVTTSYSGPNKITDHRVVQQ